MKRQLQKVERMKEKTFILTSNKFSSVLGLGVLSFKWYRSAAKDFNKSIPEK